MNVSAKSGSKLTGEDLLSRLQKKDGYIYAELYWWESKSLKHIKLIYCKVDWISFNNDGMLFAYKFIIYNVVYNWFFFLR
jgi:hypothetical protein